jgi:hypothetical protein
MDLGYTAENAANAIRDFHKAMYRCFNRDYMELQKVAIPEDLMENEDFFFNLPDEYNTDFINLVITGLTLKQSYEMLKETYEF